MACVEAFILFRLKAYSDIAPHKFASKDVLFQGLQYIS